MQRLHLDALLGESPEVRDIPLQIDRTRPIAEVARELADAAALTPAEWQTLGLIVNPPGLAPLALALIAEIHGRSGHFPAILNIRPVAGTTPTYYEVAEIVDVQALRDARPALSREPTTDQPILKEQVTELNGQIYDLCDLVGGHW